MKYPLFYHQCNYLLKYIDIIKQIKSGDRKAERLLFDHLAPRLLTMCRRYAHDENMAKDYCQESFIRVFDKLEIFDEKQGSFESWFFKVALNVILTSKRSNKRKLPITYVEELPEVEMDQGELKLLSDDELLACIQQLPEGYKEVINLHIFEQLSHKEIGELLGIQASTSRTQFMRAKRFMKQLLKKRIPDLYERKLA